jgi:DNA-binding MarR family transcriptional regulator
VSACIVSIKQTTTMRKRQVEPTEAAIDALVSASRVLTGIAVRSIAQAVPDVTVPQHRLLVLLASRGPQTVNAIAAELGVNQSNASRQCDRLRKRHLVERESSLADGRAVLTSVTDAGLHVLDRVMEERRRQVRRVVETMTAAEVDLVATALDRFSTAADEAAGWSSRPTGAPERPSRGSTPT